MGPVGIEPTFSAWKADVLPLDEGDIDNNHVINAGQEGFEPPSLVLKTNILPLNYCQNNVTMVRLRVELRLLGNEPNVLPLHYLVKIE